MSPVYTEGWFTPAAMHNTEASTKDSTDMIISAQFSPKTLK